MRNLAPVDQSKDIPTKGDIDDVVVRYASVDASGLVSFKNADNIEVFTLQLPLTSLSMSKSLSAAGWYRVLQTNDLAGQSFDFAICRRGTSADNEVHNVSLGVLYGGKYAWMEENSACGTNQLIDKIRYSCDSNHAYVDIHYTGTSANTVYVDFRPHGAADGAMSISKALTAVVDAPSGETVVSTYSFSREGTFLEKLGVYGDFVGGGITNGDDGFLFRSSNSVSAKELMKTLWSAAPASGWSSGSITVDGLSNYRLFLVRICSSANTIYGPLLIGSLGSNRADGTPTTFTASVFNGSGTNAITLSLQASVSGDTLTMSRAAYVNMKNWDIASGQKVIEIIGII